MAIHSRYYKADRRGKSKILDEFCATCGYHRKYALRRLNAAKNRRQQTNPAEHQSIIARK